MAISRLQWYESSRTRHASYRRLPRYPHPTVFDTSGKSICRSPTRDGQVHTFSRYKGKQIPILGRTGSGLQRHFCCAVVDGREEDVDSYAQFAASKGLVNSHVIDTHVHADHLSGGLSLAQKVGAEYCLHESADVEVPFERLTDNQEITLGNVTSKVLHTPGHAPDSVCLLVTDRRRGDAPWFVLTGDTLFVGSVGRPDLPGRARENAGQLYDSIHKKLLTLPRDVEVFPGHFAGSVCGVGMSSKPSSTIAFEKRWNPQLSQSREDFIDAVSSDVPKNPPT